MSSKRTPFATDKDGRTLFVKLKYSGINELVVMCDGLPFTFFGNEKTAYMPVADVIAWHEKELSESKGTSGNQVVLDALREAMANFKAGEVEVTQRQGQPVAGKGV